MAFYKEMWMPMLWIRCIQSNAMKWVNSQSNFCIRE